MSGKNEVGYKEKKKDGSDWQENNKEKRMRADSVIWEREKGFNITLDRPDVHFSEVKD